MRYFTTHSIGPLRKLTPEGFLVCLDVPISRTGEYQYSSEECGIDSPTGMVTAERSEEEVFAPEAIASFEGKPVTMEHPGEGVDPSTWRHVAVGTVTNVRRGDGEKSDLLLADLVIHDQQAIDLINAGVREVSCGYDVEPVQLAPGRVAHHKIRGNHVALVRRGRAGSRCAVGDEEQKGVFGLEEKVKTTVRAFLEALGISWGGTTPPPEDKKTDEGGNPVEESKKDKTAEQQKDQPTLEERLIVLEKAVGKLIEMKQEPATDQGDPEKEKKDSEENLKNAAPKKEVMDGIRASGAILAPEIPHIVMDSVDSGVAYMRRVLAAAVADEGRAKSVRVFIGDAAVKDLSDSDVEIAFKGAAKLVGEANNARLLTASKLQDTMSRGPKTIDEMNQANRKFWKR